MKIVVRVFLVLMALLLAGYAFVSKDNPIIDRNQNPAGITNLHLIDENLLGLIESRTNFSDLASESEFYLETAIRMAPGDPIGEQAFDLFEEEAVLGWTGSSGDHMPADVRSNLDALRELVALERAKGRTR